MSRQSELPLLDFFFLKKEINYQHFPELAYLALVTCFNLGFFNNLPVLTVFVSFLLQNWIAFTNLRVDNFTITDTLVFTNTISPSNQDNFAFCQVIIANPWHF